MVLVLAAVSSSSSSFSCSSRRSHFNAHSTILTPGQNSLISWIHLVLTFSSEPRLSTCSRVLVDARSRIQNWMIERERERKTYTKTEHDRLRIVIAQRPQPVIFLLTCGVPERQLHVYVVHEDIVDVVLEYCWFIDGLYCVHRFVSVRILQYRKLDEGRDLEGIYRLEERIHGQTYRKESSCKDIEQTRFPTCAVTEEDELALHHFLAAAEWHVWVCIRLYR